MPNDGSPANAANPKVAETSSILKSLAKALLSADISPTWSPNVERRPVYSEDTEKSREAKRQIARVQPFLEWATSSDESEIDVDGLNKAIGLLNLLVTSPAPIPMLSIGDDGKSSLYIRSGDKSIEAVIDGDTLEYFFQGPHSQIFRDGKMEQGRIPAHLVYLLYSQFAVNAATQAA